MKIRTLAKALVPLLLIHPLAGFAATCTFDKTLSCTQTRDILNDKNAAGLPYFASTNYDHSISGETNQYRTNLVQPYTDSVGAKGQLKFLMQRIQSNGNIRFYSGEIMTRQNLDQPPFSSGKKSTPWTTKENKHGYLEVVVKMPICDNAYCTSNPQAAKQRGFWPAIWLEPTNDSNWPMNGEIDIAEAYKAGLPSPYTVSTATVHFCNGDGLSWCSGDYAGGAGFDMGTADAKKNLFDGFHKWGFEWQPDPNSSSGGMLMTGYLDDVRAWGPLKTDSLPADGKKGISRGFNDASGGYYLIVNFATEGPYAGPIVDNNVTNGTMYVQSIKSFEVSGSTPPPPPPPSACNDPINIQSMYSPTKKQVTIAWEQPTVSSSNPIKNYQVSDWQKKVLWTGSGNTDRKFQDQTLPGQPGTYIYYLNTVCQNGSSTGVQYNVVINQDGSVRVVLPK